jgi:serine/threonine-protein kinase
VGRVSESGSNVQELSGTILKGYDLGGCLGSSSHTAVYRARRSGAQWAVKVFDGRLEPDASLADRLRREAGAMEGVRLRYVLPIEDAGRSGRLTFAASQLVRAQSLREVMSRGRMDDERAWSILTRLATALDGLHGRGLVHRALRPEHVLVDDGGIHLAEVGAASNRVGPLMLRSPSYQAVAPQYLAPEQVEGLEPDWRADVYALGVLVFEMLTGTPLHDATTPADVLSATLAGRPPSAHDRQPDLPRALDRVLGRAMAHSPDDRHRSAGDLLQDLVNLPDDVAPHVLALPAPAAVPAPVPSLVPAVVGLAGVPRAAAPADSMLGVLRRMGVPALRGQHDAILNSYFAALVWFARAACEERWPAVAAAAGLHAYVAEAPPDDDTRGAPLLAASSLADGIDAVFGPGALEVLRVWGRLTTDFWIRRMQRLQEGEVTYMKPIRLRTTAEQKVEDAMYVYMRNLDRIRGERLTTWKRVEKRQFWVVHYDNLTAVGRRRQARACEFSTAALQQALRWGGCANEWFVEEAECGCVTGTYDCVFTIQRVRS